MTVTRRTLPYTKQLVLLALYDVLEQEQSDYRKDESNGNIITRINVYGNKSEFTVSITEQSPATDLTVAVTSPCEGLSEQGKQRAVDFLADRIEQLLENELKINALLKAKKEGTDHE